MATSNIEWTDDTWNPTVGCTKVSAGCKHCYAETMHARLTAMRQPKYADPFTVVKPYPAHLAVPLRAGRPRRYFVNSMSDLFHEDVPDDYIAAVFGVMAAARQHTFQILTKRADRLQHWFDWAMKGGIGVQEFDVGAIQRAGDALHGTDGAALLDRAIAGCNTDAATWPGWPLPNVWLGVSVENQEQAEERIPQLLAVPAAVRFLSCEPLLECVDLRNIRYAAGRGVMHNIDALKGYGGWTAPRREHAVQWVIVGGESGRGARPFDLAWARSLIAQCRAAGVPVFMKQIGKVVIGFDGNQYERDDKGGGSREVGRGAARARVANGVTNVDQVPLGRVLGSVEVIDGCRFADKPFPDCLPDDWPRIARAEGHFGNYAFGRAGLLFVEPKPLASPIVARGMNGLWNWNPPAEALLEMEAR